MARRCQVDAVSTNYPSVCISTAANLETMATGPRDPTEREREHATIVLYARHRIRSLCMSIPRKCRHLHWRKPSSDDLQALASRQYIFQVPVAHTCASGKVGGSGVAERRSNSTLSGKRRHGLAEPYHVNMKCILFKITTASAFWLSLGFPFLHSSQYVVLVKMSTSRPQKRR
jgi:hypothetical protein